MYIPEYDYEHDKPEDILKMSANTFDYDRFVKEWQVSADSQSSNMSSALPNYYNPTISSILNENQTKLIYNTENSKQNRINYQKNSSNRSSVSSNSSQSSKSELKYVMYLATVVRDDHASSDKSLVVLNNTKLKHEIDSNLGIFSKTFKNNFNNNSAIKIKKQISEFIPGKENMPGCDIEITITAEDVSTSSSHENTKSRSDEPSQISSSNLSSKSFTQEAKHILQQHLKQHLEKHAANTIKENNSNLKSMSSNSTLNISELSDNDKPVNSNDSSDHIYCQISDAASTSSKQETILRKANERHKSRKQIKKKNSRNNSSESLVKKMKKRKKEFAIYANEPPVVRFYEPLEDTKNSELKLGEKKKKRQAPVIIKKPVDSSNESQTDDRASKQVQEVFYDSLELTDPQNTEFKDSLDDDEPNTSVTSRHERQNSILLNKILLINQEENYKKDARMFHTE